MKIFAVHSNRTDFLNLQYNSLKKFCKDSFEYYCIDNFTQSKDQNFIKNECEKLGINYIRFNNYDISGTALDHAPALNSIKNITNDSDVNVILDFDIFLINHFSFVNFIDGYDIAGMYQQRNNFNIEYLSPFIVIVNKDSNFSEITFDSGNGCDVGGNTQFYLNNKKIKLLKHTSALNKEKDKECFLIPYDSSYGCQILESSFLHYYRGSNWDRRSEDYKNDKTNWLYEALEISKNTNILNENYLSKYQTVFSHSFEYWNGTNESFKSILSSFLYS